MDREAWRLSPNHGRGVESATCKAWRGHQVSQVGEDVRPLNVEDNWRSWTHLKVGVTSSAKGKTRLGDSIWVGILARVVGWHVPTCRCDVVGSCHMVRIHVGNSEHTMGAWESRHYESVWLRGSGMWVESHETPRECTNLGWPRGVEYAKHGLLLWTCTRLATSGRE